MTPTPARFLLAVLALALGASSSACRREVPAPDLLAGLRPSRVDGIANAERITDGLSAAEGDDWSSSAAAVFQLPGALVEYDLGRPVRIRAATVQGDNNDDYVVSLSEDGTTFRELWVAGPVSVPGLRERATRDLDAVGRWIRLGARGGDGHFSVAELQLYADGRGALGGRPIKASPEVRAARVRTDALYLTLAFGLLLFGVGAGSSRRRVLLLSLAPLAALGFAVAAAADAWPLGAGEVSFVRATAAAIALLAVVRAVRRAGRFAAHRPTVVGAAAFAALLAFASFYNLGRPQCWNQALRRPLFVHVLDMRVYQPFVKYFGELGYDGVYLASVLAYAEDERGGSVASLGATEIRDQRDHRMRRVSDLTGDIQEIRKRFSDARWVEFKKDMSFFRATMGAGYMDSLTDHGANAPPVWVWLARPFLAHVTASEVSLTVAGLVDAVLFLGMAWALGACFGLLPMLVAMTVFGANDLYMFGSNWAGATLRHDWMALLAFAACALRGRRWLLAGVLLGLAAMLRAFPVVALAGVALPGLAWFVERWARHGRPSLREALAENRGAVRVLAAAGATIVVAFLITGLLYSFAAWGQWWRKVALLNDDLAVNEVSLRALVAGTEGGAAALFRARGVLYVAAQLGCAALFVLAARKRPLEEAMLLALPLALVVTHPVNYHLHLVFLLVLVGARGELLALSAPLLAMCVAQYWATLDPDAGRHFQLLTAMLFAALGWFYANVVRTNLRGAPPVDQAPG